MNRVTFFQPGEFNGDHVAAVARAARKRLAERTRLAAITAKPVRNLHK